MSRPALTPAATPTRRRRSLRSWAERAGSCPATIPVWTCRDAWLTGVRVWAAAHHSAATAATVTAIAGAMAAAADHCTGRNCAITRATIATQVGCSPRTVTSAWAVLREAGWVHEARRGHGSAGGGTASRRPSVYHLVPVRAAAKAGERCHLPPPKEVGSLAPVGRVVTKGRCAAAKRASTRKQPRQPRPIALQRLAGRLQARVLGLHRVHPGAIADALASAGIDPAGWTAEQVQRRLDRAARGRPWLTDTERPAGYLASRLREIDWTSAPPRPAPRPAPPPEPAPRPASAAHRAAAIAAYRASRRLATTDTACDVCGAETNAEAVCAPCAAAAGGEVRERRRWAG